NESTLQAFRFTLATEVVTLVRTHCRRGFKHVAIVAPVDEVRIRNGAVRNKLANNHESFRRLEWKRSKQNRVDDAEDRGVRTDTQTERQHRDDGEARMFEEHASAVTQILPDRLHKSPSPYLVRKVSDARHVSKTFCGRKARFFRRHSHFAIGFGFHLEMSTQLFVD